MKKIKLLLLLLLFFLIPNIVNASEKYNIYFFHGDGCPHCEAEIRYLDKIKDEYNINIIDYEVWYNKENHEFYNKVATTLGVSTSVPFTVIGTDYYTGFGEEYKKPIEDSIKSLNDNSIDVIEMIKNGEDVSNIKFNEDSNIKYINVFGKVIALDAKNVSLPIISIIIGFVDGFNPCSMWVLLFLIGMLINMKDKKKMFILGFTFLFSSAIIYLLLMGAWLKISIDLKTISWLKYIISIIALVAGVLNICNFIKDIKKPNGCNVVDEQKRTKTFSKIKKILSEKHFYLAIIGIILLAFSVNAIELACSLGLPLIFTQILSLNDLSTFQYIIYMLLYVFFYLIDDIVIFTIAVFTLNVKGISGKYTKYSHLIGGIIMLLIGILMIFKPDLLMFNF